ncbi:MAG: hypothetical protein R3B96_00725 [Pirellulaceae bacterium]|nr:hypothetical protein [Planctomycetales bacterium]
MDFQEGETPPGVSLCGADETSLVSQLARLEDGQRAMADEVGQRQELQIQLLETLVERISSIRPESPSEDREAWSERFRAIESERDELRRQLEENGSASGDDEEAEDLRRRLEMALDDLREARGQIDRLESGKVPTANGDLDWEAQKRCLLEQLDDAGDDLAPTDRISVQQIIDATDEVVRRKDEEIDELERLLAQQSENIGGFAVGAAAVEQLLETDELIQQERENLDRLQAEWRDKLKRAEIEISMERARLARERKELEAQLETFEQEKTRLEGLLAQKSEPTRCRDNSPRNRWFSRLGLSDSGEQG